MRFSLLTGEKQHSISLNLAKEGDSVQISESFIFRINERILHNRLSQNTHELYKINCDSKHMDS